MNYTEFKEAVIANAKALGLTEYELYYTAEEGIHAGVLFHELNAFSTDAGAGACFRCVSEGKMGYASTEKFTLEEAERIVRTALSNAGYIESEGSAIIHEAGDTYPELETVMEEAPSAADLIQLALATQEAAYKADPLIADGTRSNSYYQKQEVALCNSKGLDLSYTCSYCLALCFASAKKDGENYSGHEIKAGPFSSLNVQEIAGKAAEKAISRVGEDSLPTGSYTIAFSSGITATMLQVFFLAFSGRAAAQGLSLIAGKEGETVASPLVTIRDDAFRKGSLIQIPFDSEGVATYNKAVVENGVLKTLLHNLTTAAKAGIPSTGNGVKGSYASDVSISPYSFYIEAGDAGSKEDIFKKIGNGVYVTEFNGTHAGANPVSGDFSLSSSGYLIENGKKGRPVKNFTVSGNFYQWLKDISMVGSDLEFDTPNGTSAFGGPTVVVENMSVAGK